MRRPEKPVPPWQERVKNKQTSIGERHYVKPTFLICKFKAGASVDCLQAYAGDGSGLTKGEHGNKPYG